MQLASFVVASAVGIAVHAQGMSFLPHFSDSLHEVKIDGRIVAVRTGVLETLRQDAATRLPCDADEVSARWLQLAGWHGVYVAFAEGCVERMIYGFELPTGVKPDYPQLYTLSRVSLASGR